MAIQTDDRELDVNIYFPEAEGKYPLLLFSHGNWSDKDSYDVVIQHWVSHGYVVIAPNHLDCCNMLMGLVNSIRYGQMGLVEARIDDFIFMLDHLDEVEGSSQGLAGKIDATRIAATGHSFGAFTSQQFAGAGITDIDNGKDVFFRDERIKVVVAISPPGPMFDMITEKSWLAVDKPMLVTTGTWDSEPTYFPDWRVHKLSHDTAMTGEQYALITQGADHYLGNLICRLERKEAPQHDALKMINATTLAFLDAYLKDNPEGKAFINDDTLSSVTGGFSILERR